jgi:dihydroxyacetone kinase
MRNHDVAEWLARAMRVVAGCEDELASLDAAAGDGDLGVTISRGAAAVVDAVERLPAGTGPVETLRAVGAAFARGNPSSFAALTGIGLVVAARAVEGAVDWDRATALTVARTAARAIAERGRAQPGERTVLDALIPSADALEPHTTRHTSLSTVLEDMIGAARAGTEATRTMLPRRGRAAWTGDRAVGKPDAGATAYVRFVEALSQTMTPPASPLPAQPTPEPPASALPASAPPASAPPEPAPGAAGSTGGTIRGMLD